MKEEKCSEKIFEKIEKHFDLFYDFMKRVGQNLGEEAFDVLWSAHRAWKKSYGFAIFWDKRFPISAFVKEYTKTYLERFLREKIPYDFAMRLYYEAECQRFEKTRDYHPWEEIGAELAVRRVREPARCPYCGRYIGNFRPNEIWLLGDEDLNSHKSHIKK